MSNREWSKFQEAVFENIGSGRGHLVVEARAGGGKTTTLIEGVSRIPNIAGFGERDGKRVLLCAFNKTIQSELQERAPAKVDVKTLHGIGFSVVRKQFRGVRVDENKAKDHAIDALHNCGRCHVRDKITGQMRPSFVESNKVVKLASWAKNTLMDPTNLRNLEYRAISLDLEEDDFSAREIAEVTSEAITEMQDDHVRIDFDDMIWFPAVYGMRCAWYDVVLVDETQDLNAAQLDLAKRLCKRGGRIIAIGDSFQSLYSFRGADPNAMRRMINELDAEVLPLSITYRCASSIVDLVRDIVPDLQAAPGAPVGEVLHRGLDAIDQAKPGDFVLSRANAPLMRTCLGFLKHGIPACVVGKDLGKSLALLIEKSEATTTAQLLAWLRDHCASETERFIDLDREDKAEELADKCDTIEALAEDETTVSAVLAKIGRLFEDGDPRSKVACSTVHKAKGLERDTVYLIADTFRPHRGMREEDNVFYVACTRAKTKLVFAWKDPAARGAKPASPTASFDYGDED